MTFNNLLTKYRKISFSERDKGDRFERLMQTYLQTDPKYTSVLKKVWMWNEFPGKNDLGGSDTGIDLVAQTFDGDYWAIQCKCYREGAVIDKPAVDSFLATSGRSFYTPELKKVGFSNCLWIDTTGRKWGSNAEEAIKNQSPPVTRLNLHELQEALVDWEKLDQGISGEISRTAHRELKPHQKVALENAHEYFKTADRGKLIMACGTGKTFNSLRIAEKETERENERENEKERENESFVLFLVPSIALLGQTLREWTSYAKEPIHAICICSDSEVSRKKTKNDDSDNFSVVDLALPASTNTKDIINQLNHIKARKASGMTVVFSTYQSIEVIARAQKEFMKANNGFGEFDLIICDEAHRTTGVSLAGEDESSFTKVHDNDFIKAKKRLYMTATPRLYSDDTKSKAAQAEAVLCSMDDEKLYGKEIYRIGFGEAVEQGLLTDYKVLILTLSDKDVPPAVQKMITDKDNEINADDASKLIGCINALSKQILGKEGLIKDNDPAPMKRAVAFCASISVSKKITNTFNDATDAYLGSLPEEKQEQMVSVSSQHIDGTMTAPERDELLAWLKEDTANNECRVLTNVRCLSEGVDVPSLDAVMFLSARNSQVDVVQSVGRVMRLSPGKNYGYIIIPVVVPSDVEADKALDDNERYKVVWTVLNALRAHDDRFNATVNKIELNKKRPSQILVGRPEYSFDEDGHASYAGDPDGSSNFESKSKNINQQLAMQFEQLQNVVYARLVQKVGDRRYWEQWATSVAEIAERQVERISNLIKVDKKHQEAFANFLAGLQKNINPSITQQEAVEMLSQHLITKPVFEALFEGYSFVKNNPISVSMQTMLDLLEEQAIEKDTETLQKFYESVKTRAAGIDNAEGKQRIIIELYDKFFKTAFPKMVERLGIVYTPVELVDFMIHSVNDVLQKEFGRSISDENIHLLDPFTGTGTFITRLFQSGLIKPEDLERKYLNEIHANEIVLLAYYIAAINIENAYHDASNANDYKAFEGICLTDTFQLGESDESEKLFSEMFPQNSARVAKQKKAPLRVIMGNPPYSVGQKDFHDMAKNQVYKKLDSRIEQTYAAGTNSMKRSVYDAYIKAFRWSTDRLDKNGGIISFVSNGSWIDGQATDGFRKCLEVEFSSIYVFNLRGNQRTSGELSRKEGGKIFGSGSRTPIAITLLVKNPKSKNVKAKIQYYEVGDYLNREDKLNLINNFKSITNDKIQLKDLEPNEHGDWISQRNNLFDTFIELGDKKENRSVFFNRYSAGVITNRESWTYSFSNNQLRKQIKSMIDFYNNEVNKYSGLLKNGSNLSIESIVSKDTKKIKWDQGLMDDASKLRQINFEDKSVRLGLYRPFLKQHLYFNKNLNWSRYQMPSIFPVSNSKNIVICISGSGGTKEFTCVITDCIPDRQMQFNGQCFPLYYYEERQKQNPGLFDAAGESEYIRRDGVSDFILERAKTIYGKTIGKEDIFYYVYGFLHSPEYREMFANDLKKMLPRLPLVEDVRDFWKFSKVGRELAELHINYETVPAFEGVNLTGADNGFYKVEKMRFPKKDQKDSIIYNSQITISNIPAKAYEYVVNGKSAIEWIMERYQIITHKESGIKNDPNDWAEEVGNPRYILDLLLSIINVSVKTVGIVEGLPKVKFE